MPPAWSCQPPPVVNICSSTSVRRMRSSCVQPSAHTSDRVPSAVAARMLLVPRPEPLGTAASRLSSRPPPKASSCACSDGKASSLGKARVEPGQRQRRLDDGEGVTHPGVVTDLLVGGQGLVDAQVDRAHHDLGVGRWRANTWIGSWPFSSTATFSTQPPASRQ